MKKLALGLLFLSSFVLAENINMDINKEYWSKTQMFKATKAWYNNKVIKVDKDDYGWAIGVFKGQEIFYTKKDGKIEFSSNGIFFDLDKDFLSDLSKERFQYKMIGVENFAWIVYDRSYKKFYFEMDIQRFVDFDSTPLLVKISLEDSDREKLAKWIVQHIKIDDSTAKKYNMEVDNRFIESLATDISEKVFVKETKVNN